MSKPKSASEAVSAELADKPLTARALRAIKEIGERHFKEKPRKVRRLGGGRTNLVIQFRVSQGDFVFRMHEDACKVHDYLKEQWAMDAARAVGVPTAKVLEVGSLPDGRPYMIQERVQGVEARQLGDRMAPLRELGELAARLHAVKTKGFGTTFDWSSNALSRHTSWRDYLARSFDAGGRLALLRRHRMLNERQSRALRLSIRALESWRPTSALQHGDLRLKNLVVDPDTGRIKALVDWENCLSWPAPYWDLSIALHELGIDEKEAFLEGYGMNPARFGKHVPVVRMINVLNYAHAVHSAAHHKDRAQLAWLRLRLAAGLDLFECSN